MQFVHIVSVSCALLISLNLNSCTQLLSNESFQLEYKKSAFECSVTESLEYLNEQIKKIKFAKRKEFILIVGDGGAEKIFLNLLLIEADLKVVATDPFKFTYTDRHDLIRKLSESVISESISDEKSGLESYIVPGWKLTMDTKHEMTSLYSAQRVLNFAHMVKIVFVIDSCWFPEVGASHKERWYLREFVTNATIWMTHMKYAFNGFSLVITNVNANDGYDDDYVIVNFARVLDDVKEDFLKKGNGSELNLNRMKFILNLLERIDTRYKFIGVLQIANQTGSVADMPWLQIQRKKISENIRNFTQYIDRKDVDFSFSFSTKTTQQLPEFIKQMQTILHL